MPEFNQRETGGPSPSTRRTAVPIDELGPVSPAYDQAPHVTTSSEPPPGFDPALATPVATKKKPSALREIIETLLLAFLIFVAVRSLVLNFRVDGSSMVPNLHNSEMLLVNRNVYMHFDLNKWLDYIPGQDHDQPRIVYPFHPPERGDIIVFNPPTLSDKPYIKRVIGLAGETVEIKNGAVYIDGVKLDEPYIQDGITECNQVNCTPWKIPDGYIFVMGDNRRNSSDSRIFGPVKIDSIIGKASLTYWPFRDFGLVPHYDYDD